MPENLTNSLIKAMALVAVFCMLQATLAVAASPSIQVYPQTIVQADRVRLADLAGLSGIDEDRAEVLRQIEIGAAPAGGTFQAVDVESIRKALLAADVNLADLCIVGAAECKVFRPAEPEAPVVPVKAADGQVAAAEAAGEPDTLEAAVRAFLVGRTTGLQGQVEVRFAAAHRNVLPLAGPAMTFQVRPRTDALLGLLSLEIDVLEAGKVARTIPMVAEVGLTKGVVVARRPINRGTAIRPEDIAVEPRRFNKAEDVGLAATGLVVNRQAKRYIARGEMLTGRDVQPMPLVKRGDYVTVWFKRGDLTIRGGAKALQEGCQGERIEVKAEPGGQVYNVVVTGTKTVQADAGTSLLSRAD